MGRGDRDLPRGLLGPSGSNIVAGLLLLLLAFSRDCCRRLISFGWLWGSAAAFFNHSRPASIYSWTLAVVRCLERLVKRHEHILQTGFFSWHEPQICAMI